MTVVPFFRKSAGTPTFYRYVECIEQNFELGAGQLDANDRDAVYARLPSLVAYIAGSGKLACFPVIEDFSVIALKWLLVTLASVCGTMLKEAIEDVDIRGGIRARRFSLDPYEATALDASLVELIGYLKVRHSALTGDPRAEQS